MAEDQGQAPSLRPDDLCDVLEDTMDCSAKWEKLGIRLKVPTDKLDAIKNQSGDSGDHLCEVLKLWLKRVARSRPTWGVLVEALRSQTVGAPKLADELEAKRCQGSCCTVSEESLVNRFRRKVEDLSSTKCNSKQEEEYKVNMIKIVVREYVIASKKLDSTKEHIESHLQRKSDFLLSEIYKWAKQLVAEIFENTEVDELSCEPLSCNDPSGPLFCKDTVYHASICSHAINESDASEHLKTKFPGHSFQAVSISESKQDHYLIAQQGKSTYYIAFQSEPDLSKWPELFKSFSEGIKIQSERFPVHFIVELLTNKKCRIILTGFSFGGLLACAIASRVWDVDTTGCIGSNLLKENLVCITFAQPLIPVPLLPKVARERSELISTIHTIYWEGDLVPRLSRFLSECCSSLGSEEKHSLWLGIQTQPEPELSFKDPATCLLFEHLGKLQRGTVKEGQLPEITKADCLSELKVTLNLKNLAAAADSKQFLLYTTPYLVSLDLTTGLQWGKMTQEQALLQSSYLQSGEIETLTTELFKEHSMAEYYKKIFLSFLEKCPEYAPPSPAKQLPMELTMLKPSITSVEVDSRDPNKLDIVVEGRNLWFCYQISIGGHTIRTPACDLSGTLIRIKESEIKVVEEKVMVVIYSHFSKIPLSNVVQVFQKEYHITSRQKQLARLTPSQLIELAYLSALLERHPYGPFQPVSQKVEVITRFLEDVVQVVPLESITYAISQDVIGIQCAEAFMSTHCQLNPPFSLLMRIGLEKALKQIQPGVSPAVTFDRHFIMNEEQSAGLDRKKLKEEYGEVPAQNVVPHKVVAYLLKLQKELFHHERAAEKQGNAIICGQTLDQLYPITTAPTQQSSILKSPLSILREGRCTLNSLANGSLISDSQHPNEGMPPLCNALMLKSVNEIRQGDLAICTSLLGGFMEQRVDIPLVKSQSDCSEALSISISASVGAWALSSLEYSTIQPILAQCHGNQLPMKIEETILSAKAMASEADNNQFAAKLQFIVQLIVKTVTCNTQYITYSLDHKLSELGIEQKVDACFTLDKLVKQWERFFKDNVLSLVPISHRPHIARWLKWALMVHNLREELAKYTAVGVVGLVNSGKSRLVNTLFGIEIPTGTTQVKRTTVPFMYNLDEKVEGLEVVDFPGVDDGDETISDLIDLFLTLSQIFIFVVDYRKVDTGSVKKWLERLQVENVPILVCLTFADQLYAELDGKESVRYQLEIEQSRIQRKLGSSPSCVIKFFSFSQDHDSMCNRGDGRHRMREVGIGTPLEVGEWLVYMFQEYFHQKHLAERLCGFMHKIQTSTP